MFMAGQFVFTYIRIYTVIFIYLVVFLNLSAVMIDQCWLFSLVADGCFWMGYIIVSSAAVGNIASASNISIYGKQHTEIQWNTEIYVHAYYIYTCIALELSYKRILLSGGSFCVCYLRCAVYLLQCVYKTYNWVYIIFALVLVSNSMRNVWLY